MNTPATRGFSTPMDFPSDQSLVLRCRSVRSVHLAEFDHVQLSADEGAAWVTMEGDADDHLLDGASPLEFQGPGHLVIESIRGPLSLRIRSGTVFPVQDGPPSHPRDGRQPMGLM